MFGLRNFFIIAIFGFQIVFGQKLTNISKVQIADNGDGTYTNPIIHSDFSDPDVIRVNDDYYMTASSFNCMPGLPILHSKDLVNWELINYAIKNYPHSICMTNLNTGKVFGHLV